MNAASHQDHKGQRVLVVDDEEDICDIVRLQLEEHGFIVQVAHNGLEGWQKLERQLPDAVILDVMLPGLSGIDFCKKIKSKYDIPVLMISARSEETDAVVGLEVGADDYIRKPFSPRELLARVRAVMRRQAQKESAEILSTGRIQIDTTAHRATVDGAVIDLTPLEYDLLLLFLENPDVAFSRDRLLDRVWGRTVYVSDRTIDVNMKRLREKLGSEKFRIETVRGVGYRFNGKAE